MNTLLRINKRLARRAFEQAAAHYDETAFLQREIGDRLLERLAVIKFGPKRILDLGAGTGYCTRKLMQLYPAAQVIALDIAQAMLLQFKQKLPWRLRWRRRCHSVIGDAEALPLADASVDMIFSNLTLQWCNDLNTVFAEFRRVLAPGGTVLFTTFGPDTLHELRDSWRRVDHYSHINGFLDMHDIGDIALRARLAEPVMDTERITVSYADIYRLMRDLKNIGAHNVTQQRPRGLTGRRHFAALQVAYEQYRVDGTLPATYEVIYGHAWKGIDDHAAGMSL